MKPGPEAQIRPAMPGSMRTACYWLSVCLLSLATGLIIEGALGLHLVFGWLIAVNVFTFLYFGIDKLNSIWEDEKPENRAAKARIPEHALLLMALVGGSVGGLLGMLVCNHKTDHAWFVLCLLSIVIAHGALLVHFWERIQVL
jgi:uncharacterized membrane protein YsdA (DUF1294 family)